MLEYIVYEEYAKIVSRVKIIVFLLFFLMSCYNVYLIVERLTFFSYLYTKMDVLLNVLGKLILPLAIVSIFGLFKNKIVRL